MTVGTLRPLPCAGSRDWGAVAGEYLSAGTVVAVPASTAAWRVARGVAEAP